MCIKTLINDGGLAQVIEVADRVSTDLFVLNRRRNNGSSSGSTNSAQPGSVSKLIRHGHGKRQRRVSHSEGGESSSSSSDVVCHGGDGSCGCDKVAVSSAASTSSFAISGSDQKNVDASSTIKCYDEDKSNKDEHHSSCTAGIRRKPSRTLSEITRGNSDKLLMNEILSEQATVTTTPDNETNPHQCKEDKVEGGHHESDHEDEHHPPNVKPQHIQHKKQQNPNQPEQFKMNLSKHTSAELKQVVTPLIDCLKNLDAAALLSLNPTHRKGGAVLDKDRGLTVNPIHNFISPNYDPPITDAGNSSCGSWDDNDDEGDSNTAIEKCHIVRYLHVHEVPNKYSMGIFVFPPNAEIPLHDHPNMVVLSRVLYGELKAQSYDLLPAKRKVSKKNDSRKIKSNNCKSKRNSKKNQQQSKRKMLPEAEDPALDKEMMDQQAAAKTMISLSKPLNMLKDLVTRAMSPYNYSNVNGQGAGQEERKEVVGKKMAMNVDNGKSRETNRGDSTSADDDEEEYDEGDKSDDNASTTSSQDTEPHLASNTILKAKENLSSMGVVFQKQESSFAFPLQGDGEEGAEEGKEEAMIFAPRVTALYPYEGNCHSFVAGPQGAAMLDVLLPPYDSEDHRDCTFYKAIEEEREEVFCGHGSDNSSSCHNVFEHHHSHIHHHTRELFRHSSRTPSSNAGSSTTSASTSSSIGDTNNNGKRPRSFNLIPMTQPENFHCLSGAYGRFGACSTYGDASDTDFYSDFMSGEENEEDDNSRHDEAAVERGDMRMDGDLLDVGRCSLS